MNTIRMTINLEETLNYYDATGLPILVPSGYLPCKVELSNPDFIQVFVYSDDIKFIDPTTEAYLRTVREASFEAYQKDLDLFLELWRADMVGNLESFPGALPIFYKIPRYVNEKTLVSVHIFPVRHRIDPVSLRLKFVPNKTIINRPMRRRLYYISGFSIPGDPSIYTIELFDMPHELDFILILKDGKPFSIGEVINWFYPNMTVKNIFSMSPMTVSYEGDVEIIPLYGSDIVESNSVFIDLITKGLLNAPRE